MLLLDLHEYADSNGFLTLLSDGERLAGAYALGPEAGEWLQQATLAIRAHPPLDVLADTIIVAVEAKGFRTAGDAQPPGSAGPRTLLDLPADPGMPASSARC